MPLLLYICADHRISIVLPVILVVIQCGGVLLFIENPFQQLQVLRVIDTEPRGQNLRMDIILINVGLQAWHTCHAYLIEKETFITNNQESAMLMQRDGLI